MYWSVINSKECVCKVLLNLHEITTYILLKNPHSPKRGEQYVISLANVEAILSPFTMILLNVVSNVVGDWDLRNISQSSPGPSE